MANVPVGHLLAGSTEGRTASAVALADFIFAPTPWTLLCLGGDIVVVAAIAFRFVRQRGHESSANISRPKVDEDAGAFARAIRPSDEGLFWHRTLVAVVAFAVPVAAGVALGLGRR